MLDSLLGVCEVISKEFYRDMDKFIGDSAMAVFADANDAISAAERSLFGALPRLNEMKTKAGKKTIQVRIGLNSSKVVQGDIGTIARKDLTVIGDVGNTASRIQRICDANAPLLSEAILSLLKNPSLFQQDRKDKLIRM